MPSSKLKEQPPQRKIGVTSNLPVGRISVVTLIRTDTTLDHSQKAEKVCSIFGRFQMWIFRCDVSSARKGSMDIGAGGRDMKRRKKEKKEQKR